MSMTPQRYNSMLIILHWIMALSFILMLASGLAMVNLESMSKSLQFQMYQWHKSLGVLLLIAVILRIFLKLFTKSPKFPEKMKQWETDAAKGGHASLYVWMLIVPIAGWVMASSSIFGIPTIVFGLFEWPHIPGIAANKEIEETAKFVHWTLAYSFILLIALHIGAVLKHAIIDKENLLKRMSFTRK